MQNIPGLISAVINYLIQMRCREHDDDIKFVCYSKTCLQGLCTTCCESHRKIHRNSELLPIRKAITMAQFNISGIKKAISQLLLPFEQRAQIKFKIKQQEDMLKRQKQRLIDEVSRKIDEEINRLQKENSLSIAQKNQQEDKVKEQLKRKIAELNDLERTLKNNADKLRKALNLEITTQTESFHNSIKDYANITSLSKLYHTPLRHDFHINTLTLQSYQTRIRPITKIMNESPLYFLIDPLAATSKYLYYFLPQKRLLRIYDVDSQTWRHYQYDFALADFGSAVHDPQTDRFYWIGGTLGGKKVDSIIIFDLRQKRWQKVSLKAARSHCMAVLIKHKQQKAEIMGELFNQNNNAILIVGGIGKNEDVLKSCQLLDLNFHKIYPYGQTNFGAFSGVLVTYNGCNVLRLGGLNRSKIRNEFAVVQVVQKLDCSRWPQIITSKDEAERNPRWSYIEIQMPVKNQLQQKPRLFFANQAAIQISPNQIFVFGGLSEGLKGTTESYIIGIEQFSAFSRQLGNNKFTLQQRFSVRWPNEKPLISADDFKGVQPSIWNSKLYSLQNISSRSGSQTVTDQKRLLTFDMYEWSQTENMLLE